MMNSIIVFYKERYKSKLIGDLYNPISNDYTKFITSILKNDSLKQFNTPQIDQLKLMTFHQKFLNLMENALTNSLHKDHPLVWIPLDHLPLSPFEIQDLYPKSLFIHDSHSDGLLGEKIRPNSVIDIGEMDDLNSQLLDGITAIEQTLIKESTTSDTGYEMSSEFYDRTFLQHDHMKQHYTESHYYALWSIITDRMRFYNVNSILDIGCGPGQLSLFFKDKGISNYLGIDFSKARINHAKKICPEYKFICCDAFNTNVFETFEYDCATSFEFLEHVHGDIQVLKKIKSQTRFLGTVPNFPYVAHVRYFQSSEEVYERYSHLFKELHVTTHLRGKNGVKYFILDGILS